VKRIWAASSLGISVRNNQYVGVEEWIINWFNYFATLKNDDGSGMIIFTSILWCIWCIRNKIVWEDQGYSPQHFFRLQEKEVALAIKAMIYLKSQGLNEDNSNDDDRNTMRDIIRNLYPFYMVGKESGCNITRIKVDASWASNLRAAYGWVTYGTNSVPFFTNATKMKVECASQAEAIEESEYIKEKYGGYFGVFERMLSEEGEIWDVFNVARNELPSDEKIEEYDGFVITGSCSDAHSNELWICKLLSLLHKLDFLKKKVLGICFGHQIFELPAKVEVIGGSNKTSIEMFRYGDHMMGIQGHPEYNSDILLHLIDRLLQKDLIAVKYADEMRAKFMKAREPDTEALRKLCVAFLKGRF
ncbi:hypothetical protein KSS87_021728, partial [Heliosperma pusillum]